MEILGMVLYNIFITPIELLIEFVFMMSRAVFTDPGLCIVAVSIVVNILCLPLYKRSDALQEKERDKQKSMKKWVDHINSTFKGDERFMMLQTYYRQNNYKQTSTLNGSMSLLLQIPFFIAAFHYLSTLGLLNGQSFLFLTDLGRPDGLLVIGGFAINIMPIIMTAINVVSGVIYTRGFPTKDKVQLYVVAGIFLVLLYTSPSGLVLYWTLNNLFSLCKNIFMKVLKHPLRVLSVIVSAVGIILLAYVVYMGATGTAQSMNHYVFFSILAVACQIPLVVMLLQRRKARASEKVAAAVAVPGGAMEAASMAEADVALSGADGANASGSEDASASSGSRKAGRHERSRKASRFFGPIEPNKRIFVLGGVFMVLLCGVYIPLSVISASPSEFMVGSDSPVAILSSTASTYLGVFMWVAIFYYLARPNWKGIFTAIVWASVGMAAVDYLFFGTNFGLISTTLVYDGCMAYSMGEILLNLVVVVAVVIVFVMLLRAKPTFVRGALTVLIVAVAGLSVYGLVDTQNALASSPENDLPPTDEVASASQPIEPMISLSRTGKNTVVIMLDRSVSPFVPYMFAENPELYEQFSGFEYYPNTVSYGQFTNYGTPSLFGGYEYTPSGIDARSNESLESKQNEALKVLPRYFSENGYVTNVVDPPYAGYSWVSDNSIYDDLPGVSAHNAIGNLHSSYEGNAKPIFDAKQRRSFFCYSLTKTAPVFLQMSLYDGGNYRNSNNLDLNYLGTFLQAYAVLENMDELTTFNDNPTGSFLMFQNSATHEPTLLGQGYVPDYSKGVNNSMVRYDDSNNALRMSNTYQLAHYHVNMASYEQVGKWLDYLKENGVYDNTRIIIASDHSRNLALYPDRFTAEGVDTMALNPVLMVKDFGAKGKLKTNEQFMTLADVPELATEGITANPTNPYTGKSFASTNDKDVNRQIVTSSVNWDISTNNGNTFDASDGYWYAVSGNIFDMRNWQLVQTDLETVPLKK